MFIPQCPDRLWGPYNILRNEVPGALSLGVKGPGREGDRSPQLVSMCLHGVMLDKLTFLPSMAVLTMLYSAEVKKFGSIRPLSHTPSWLSA
jgi:hypothetical protein